MCNSQHLWKAQWSRYSKCESVKNSYRHLLHDKSTDTEWEAKRESVKHNLRLLLDPVSVFKGQTLKNRCHCFQTVICIKEVYRTMWVLDSKTLRCRRFPTHLSVGDKRAHFGCDVWSGSNRVLQSLYNAYQKHQRWALIGSWWDSTVLLKLFPTVNGCHFEPSSLAFTLYHTSNLR